jgi:hypothetical protein
MKIIPKNRLSSKNEAAFLEKTLFFFIGGNTASVVQWSEFLATDPEARVRFPALPEKKL